ncbi:MAG: hypothetical protein QXU82_03670 [Candidatus Aenigmatarchaeota archaeon]
MVEEKSEEKKEKKPFLKEGMFYPMLAAVFCALFIISSAFLATSMLTHGFLPGGMTGQAAAEKAIDFINTNMLSADQVAVLDKVSESNGLYMINFSISGNKYSTFVTMDGKLLFPQAIDLNMKIETGKKPAAFDAPDSARPEVELYVMSFCPYGQLAIKAMKPVAELLKEKADIVPHYVIYDHYCGYGIPPSMCSDDGLKAYCIANGTLCSMHGTTELNEDIRQLCVYKNYPAKWWEYVDGIINKCTLNDVETCWETVAKGAGIDATVIKNCAAKEGEGLIAAERQANLANGVQGSPAIFVNGMEYGDSRTEEGFKNAVCSGFSTEPSECSTELNSAAGTASGGCGG